MKNTILSLILFLSFVVCKAQPNITNLNYPSTVNLFDLYEISFKLNTYSLSKDLITTYYVFTQYLRVRTIDAPLSSVSITKAIHSKIKMAMKSLLATSL